MVAHFGWLVPLVAWLPILETVVLVVMRGAEVTERRATVVQTIAAILQLSDVVANRDPAFLYSAYGANHSEKCWLAGTEMSRSRS